jgi:hypothetical protein
MCLCIIWVVYKYCGTNDNLSLIRQSGDWPHAGHKSPPRDGAKTRARLRFSLDEYHSG